MILLKRYSFFLGLVVFFVSNTKLDAQTKYLTTNQVEVTKNLDNHLVSSQNSLTENLSNIASFSHYNNILSIIDFDALIARYSMVTVFVPNNDAFSQFRKGQLKNFLAASNASRLQEIVANYVIPGRVDLHAIKKAIQEGQGTARFKTIGQNYLKFTIKQNTIYLQASNGTVSELLMPNLNHSKGYFHITNGFSILKN